MPTCYNNTDNTKGQSFHSQLPHAYTGFYNEGVTWVDAGNFSKSGQG